MMKFLFLSLLLPVLLRAEDADPKCYVVVREVELGEAFPEDWNPDQNFGGNAVKLPKQLVELVIPPVDVGPIVKGEISDPEFQIWIRALRNEKHVTFTSLDTAVSQSGIPVRIESGRGQYRIQTQSGEKPGTVDLKVLLPEKEGVASGDRQTQREFQQTIQSRSMIVLAEKVDRLKVRLMLVQALQLTEE